MSENLTRLLLLALPLLGGCATTETCSTQQFFKPSAINGEAEFNRYFPGRIEFRVKGADVHLSVCDDQALDALCIDIYPRDGSTFRFTEREVVVMADVYDTAKELAITKITYGVSCHGRTLEDSECQSPTVSPLVGGGPVETQTTRFFTAGGNLYYRDTYTFSPEHAFTAAQVRVNFLMQIWRKYQAVTEQLPPSVGKEFRVKLPNVQVGDSIFALPEVAFSLVREKVCDPGRRLSLQ